MSRDFSWFISRLASSIALFFLWTTVSRWLSRNNIEIRIIVDIAILLFVVIVPFLIGSKNRSAGVTQSNTSYRIVTLVKILILIGLVAFFVPFLMLISFL